MKRNTLTKICLLKTGDRFYKASDKKKEVWTKKDPPASVQKAASKYGAIEHWALKDGTRYVEQMKVELPVVFLRHASEANVGGETAQE